MQRRSKPARAFVSTPTTLRQSLAQRWRETQLAPARARQTELAAVLDGLNALGAVERVRKAHGKPLLTHGPKALSGLEPVPWVGALLWQRGGGYYGYKLLMLVGAWALDEAGAARIIVGSKIVPYTAPFYDPEAYHHLIQRGFDAYYADPGDPPVERRTLDQVYDPTDRLRLRGNLLRALTDALAGA